GGGVERVGAWTPWRGWSGRLTGAVSGWGPPPSPSRIALPSISAARAGRGRGSGPRAPLPGQGRPRVGWLSIGGWLVRLLGGSGNHARRRPGAAGRSRRDLHRGLRDRGPDRQQAEVHRPRPPGRRGRRGARRAPRPRVLAVGRAEGPGHRLLRGG